MGGISQWLKHNETGLLCDPNDANALAQAIERFVDDTALANRLSQKARESYLRHFQPQVHLDALESLLRATAGLAEVVR